MESFVRWEIFLFFLFSCFKTLRGLVIYWGRNLKTLLFEASNGIAFTTSYVCSHEIILHYSFSKLDILVIGQLEHQLHRYNC